MALQNSIRLTGYVSTGKEKKPLELKSNTKGDKSYSVLWIRVAVPRDRKDGSGKKVYDYPDVTFFGKQAEFVAQYFKPGDLITLEGYIRTGSYEDKNGVKRYTTEIYAEHAGFPLGGKNGEGKASGGEKQASPGINPDDFEEIDVNDDLPF